MNNDLKELLMNQIALLTEWNAKNIDKEPEQVRKNIETIVICSGVIGNETVTGGGSMYHSSNEFIIRLVVEPKNNSISLIHQ